MVRSPHETTAAQSDGDSIAACTSQLIDLIIVNACVQYEQYGGCQCSIHALTVHMFKTTFSQLQKYVFVGRCAVGRAGGKESMAPWQSNIDEVERSHWIANTCTKQHGNKITIIWHWWVGELSQLLHANCGWTIDCQKATEDGKVIHSHSTVNILGDIATQTSMSRFFVHVRFGYILCWLTLAAFIGISCVSTSWNVGVYAKSTGAMFCSSTVLGLRVGNSHVYTVRPWLNWLETTRGFEFWAMSRISSGKPSEFRSCLGIS